MHVKSAFPNGKLHSEFYLHQPLGFVNLSYPNYYYKLQKVVYGLKKAPRAWYKTLACFLKRYGFHRGIIDPTLFQRSNEKNLMLVQLYVDEIIFGSANPTMVADFVKLIVS